MAKKIFGVYLAKLDAPDSEAYTRLELPASPWELHDAMDKVQLQENEELYLEVDDYYGFEYLAPHLDGSDISLNELNKLAGQLATLDEVQGIAFEGLLSMEVQKKMSTNGGIITLQDLRNLAASASADCCHVVDASSDAELGRFYAENGFVEELDGLSDDVFEMLDFGKISKALRAGENGTFTRNGYVVQHSELVTVPPCSRELPKKPNYLFRVTLGLHPDLDADQTVTLTLPASAEELKKAQKQLGADGWEGVVVLAYDGIIPQAAEFADLPAELETFNHFAEVVEDKPNIVRVMRIREDAIRELVYETIIDKGEFIFDLLDSTKVVFDISFDMDNKDLICVVHDENSFKEYGSVDFSKISSVVDETATSVYSRKRYIDLELNGEDFCIK